MKGSQAFATSYAAIGDNSLQIGAIAARPEQMELNGNTAKCDNLGSAKTKYCRFQELPGTTLNVEVFSGSGEVYRCQHGSITGTVSLYKQSCTLTVEDTLDGMADISADFL